jgi:hypothetical protein
VNEESHAQQVTQLIALGMLLVFALAVIVVAVVFAPMMIDQAMALASLIAGAAATNYFRESSSIRRTTLNGNGNGTRRRNAAD